MTVQTQPIIIDPASIVAVGAMKSGRSGRPKKGVVVEDASSRKSYALSAMAANAVSEAAAALGVSESAVVEAMARALSGRFQGT
jgi:hypothetical protein